LAFFFAILVPPCKKSFMWTHSASPIIVCILIALHTSFNKINRELKKIIVLQVCASAPPTSLNEFALQKKLALPPRHALQLF
jgi:hypothetical protein